MEVCLPADERTYHQLRTVDLRVWRTKSLRTRFVQGMKRLHRTNTKTTWSMQSATGSGTG